MSVERGLVSWEEEGVVLWSGTSSRDKARVESQNRGIIKVGRDLYDH